jgi:hypothetical protein
MGSLSVGAEYTWREEPHGSGLQTLPHQVFATAIRDHRLPQTRSEPVSRSLTRSRSSREDGVPRPPARDQDAQPTRSCSCLLTGPAMRLISGSVHCRSPWTSSSEIALISQRTDPSRQSAGDMAVVHEEGEVISVYACSSGLAKPVWSLIRASLEPYLLWRTLPPLRPTLEARLEAPRGRTTVAGDSEGSTWEPPSVPSMQDLREICPVSKGRR